jgi:tyrosine decarboxylase/aspartate 1-decarboxylase
MTSSINEQEEQELKVTYPLEPWMRLEDEPPVIPFPATGLPEQEILGQVTKRMAVNRPREKIFCVFAFWSHPIGTRALELGKDTLAVGELKNAYPQVYDMAQESIRMIGSLLHAENPAGFLTTGGTESNVSAIRLVRNLSKGKTSRPEIVMPFTGHYSFHLAEELFGIKFRLGRVNRDYSPDMRHIERLINENTVALVCSAPDGLLGVIDPVPEFAELAEKHGLHMHVDACVGGFILPFLKDLGYNIVDFDFKLPAVATMSADPHKFGLAPIPSSSIILRDRSLLRSVPVEEVYLPTLSSTGRPGANAVATWAVLKHIGRNGYINYVSNAMEITRIIVDGLEGIDGLELVREPQLNVLGIKSDKFNVESIHMEMWKKGWTIGLAFLDPYPTRFLRIVAHPCKTKELAYQLVEDLKKSVQQIA